jgi:glycosyltransferase involved in cell wall biosynthesis
MNWKAPALIVGSATVASIVLYDTYVREKAFTVKETIVDPPKTSIVLPTLNEEKYVEETLKSIRGQSIIRSAPDKFELIVVDGFSSDNTVSIAKAYADTIIYAPRGKLTARHKGTEVAKGEVIAAVDADTYYPPNWMNLMLKPIVASNRVVGVSGPRFFRSNSGPLLYYGMVLKCLLEGTCNQRMAGSNAVYLKEAYFKAGGFNLNINQSDVWQMVEEEEFNFPYRLKKLGKVVWVWEAGSYTSSRRLFGHRSSFYDRM